MSFITWDASLAIGHALIDAQHQSLVALINRLFDAKLVGAGGREGEVRQVFIELYRYTMFHFSEEEGLMQAARYADMARHKAEHQVFVRRLDELAARADDAQITLEAMSWLVDWLLDHISVSDRRLADCLERPA